MFIFYSILILVIHFHFKEVFVIFSTKWFCKIILIENSKFIFHFQNPKVILEKKNEKKFCFPQRKKFLTFFFLKRMKFFLLFFFVCFLYKNQVLRIIYKYHFRYIIYLIWRKRVQSTKFEFQKFNKLFLFD